MALSLTKLPWYWQIGAFVLLGIGAGVGFYLYIEQPMQAEWPITLEVEGTFHNLALFFDRVGKFTRIVNITNLDVRGKDKPEPNVTITATCTATTFVLFDKPQPSAKPGAKPGTPAPG